MGEGSVMMGFDQVYVVTKTHAMRPVVVVPSTARIKTWMLHPEVLHCG